MDALAGFLILFFFIVLPRLLQFPSHYVMLYTTFPTILDLSPTATCPPSSPTPLLLQIRTGSSLAAQHRVVGSAARRSGAATASSMTTPSAA